MSGEVVESVIKGMPSITEVKVIHHKSWRTYFMDLSLAVIPVVLTAYVGKSLMSMAASVMAPDDKKENDEKAKTATIHLMKAMKKSGRSGKIPRLTTHEQRLMADIWFPHQIHVNFEDIGGSKKIKEDIFETMLLPLQHPNLFKVVNGSSKRPLITAPKGVLFYGPPGTGKTMMAKAIAKNANAMFLNICMSRMRDKYVGESEKLIRAVFSLAHKFAPSVIFIDEIDSFLSSRKDDMHEASRSAQTVFMSLWDGLNTDESAPVVVLGATNRPFDLDKAVLRRLPRTFLFPLPDAKDRQAILQTILKGHHVHEDLSCEVVAELAEGYSGSDLRELCKHAAMQPIRERLRALAQERKFLVTDSDQDEDEDEDDENKNHSSDEKLADLDSKSQDNLAYKAYASIDSDDLDFDEPVRPLTMDDMLKSMEFIKPTGAASMEYAKAFQQQQHNRW